MFVTVVALNEVSFVKFRRMTSTRFAPTVQALRAVRSRGAREDGVARRRERLDFLHVEGIPARPPVDGDAVSRPKPLRGLREAKAKDLLVVRSELVVELGSLVREIVGHQDGESAGLQEGVVGSRGRPRNREESERKEEPCGDAARDTPRRDPTERDALLGRAYLFLNSAGPKTL